MAGQRLSVRAGGNNYFGPGSLRETVWLLDEMRLKSRGKIVKAAF